MRLILNQNLQLGISLFHCPLCLPYPRLHTTHEELGGEVGVWATSMGHVLKYEGHFFDKSTCLVVRYSLECIFPQPIVVCTEIMLLSSLVFSVFWACSSPWQPMLLPFLPDPDSSLRAAHDKQWSIHRQGWDVVIMTFPSTQRKCPIYCPQYVHRSTWTCEDTTLFHIAQTFHSTRRKCPIYFPSYVNLTSCERHNLISLTSYDSYRTNVLQSHALLCDARSAHMLSLTFSAPYLVLIWALHTGRTLFFFCRNVITYGERRIDRVDKVWQWSLVERFGYFDRLYYECLKRVLTQRSTRTDPT